METVLSASESTGYSYGACQWWGRGVVCATKLRWGEPMCVTSKQDLLGDIFKCMGFIKKQHWLVIIPWQDVSCTKHSCCIDEVWNSRRTPRQFTAWFFINGNTLSENTSVCHKTSESRSNVLTTNESDDFLGVNCHLAEQITGTDFFPNAMKIWWIEKRTHLPHSSFVSMHWWSCFYCSEFSCVQLPWTDKVQCVPEIRVVLSRLVPCSVLCDLLTGCWRLYNGRQWCLLVRRNNCIPTLLSQYTGTCTKKKNNPSCWGTGAKCAKKVEEEEEEEEERREEIQPQ